MKPMQVDPITLKNQSKLINDYHNNETSLMNFFDYHPFYETTYQKRSLDLQERCFNREKLTEVLTVMNTQWDAPISTHENISKLLGENSSVVIGGQQAGLLTGPLYTINKLISVIQLAREQQEQLDSPVIPVFWIAGEDHDFEEINHLFLPDVPQMKKYTLDQKITRKMPVSAIEKDEAQAKAWIDQLFSDLQETVHTKTLYATVMDCLDKSTTYVDFFSRVIYALFSEEGVVLVDSAHPDLRKLESEHFLSMIKKQDDIAYGVYQNEQLLKQLGYSNSLEVEPDDAHLFYQDEKNRILLSRTSAGEWKGKQNEIVLSTEELENIAIKYPERLSNNVVTRPLMQELLFPTLAFIGGPGEVGYWSALKPAFHALKINMPPVVPRLSFTFIERKVEKLLRKYGMKADKVVNDGVNKERGNWLAAKSNPPLEPMMSQLKRTIEEAHQPLQDVACNIRKDLGDLAEKNLTYLLRDVDYLKNRLDKELEAKYAEALHEFDTIHTALHPNGGLQERVWNPLPLLNQYGNDFIKQLIRTPCSITNKHYLVFI